MDYEADDGERESNLPWTTAPSGQGRSYCAWCGRDIHLPAHPCSATGGAGIAAANTIPGLGERCKWELRTRDVGSN